MASVPTYDPAAPLPAAADFYRLRREGIGRITETSGALWTDYNTHDPGITILEALAYAITELAYRTGFPIEDILASAAGTATDPADPYPDQAFPSARRILTVNPTTTADLRRLLTDVGAVRNAWAGGAPAGCVTEFHVWCEEGELIASYDPADRADPATPYTTVRPRGLYRILLELETDPELGDLNDRTIVRRHTVIDDDGRRHDFTAELRFPAWGAAREGERTRLRDAAALQQVAVAGPNRTPTGTTPVDTAEFRRHWFDVFYVDVVIVLEDGTTIDVENVTLRVFGDGAVRRQADPAAVGEWLADPGPDGVVAQYRRKLAATDQATAAARSTLEAHRNLDEDWCRVDLVEITDIAVCADVEVSATADIELVQAQIWFTLERYLAPPVDFASLDELRSRGVPSETIFDGPELSGGFLTDQVLRDTDLRGQLRVSDIVNLLLDIDGVLSVDGLLLTAYDPLGRPIPGISDPDRSSGSAVFDPNRISAAWTMAITSARRPRLHRLLSQLSFSSGGLPFTPRSDEVDDTLVQLRGRAARPPIPATELDLPIPVGSARELEVYQPVQHSLPAGYGIGPAGLPSSATAARRAQARQLKAYLMVFEQLLRHRYAQLAHAPDLFSLDPTVDHTYFTALLDDVGLTGYDRIVDAGLTREVLAGLVESTGEFEVRRNGFLDHLLARFGESFADYALVLTDLEGRTRADDELIRAKLAFLRALPRIGHDRAKAFNRRVAPTDPDNASGLRQRMNLLLGLPDWTMVYRAGAGATPTLTVDELDDTVVILVLPAEVDAAFDAVVADRWPGGAPATGWSIRSGDGRLILTTMIDGRLRSEDLAGPGGPPAGRTLGRLLADRQRAVLAGIVGSGNHAAEDAGAGWRVALTDRNGHRLGTAEGFATRRLALAFIARLSAWAAHQRSIVVEHLLLRPKFPGDALYPVCRDADPAGVDSGCGCGCGCGGEDPYSFRLTYVMPGWTEPYSSNMGMRGYADRTIREHTPSHLIVKTCWVGNDGFVPDPCDPVVDDLAGALRAHGDDEATACECAARILAAYQRAFADWFAEHPLLRRPRPVLETLLGPVLSAVDLSATGCPELADAQVRSAIETRLAAHFAGIAMRGYQFERFEDAWCAWADADARIDWSAEHLDAVVRDLLATGAVAPIDPATLAATATAILREFGRSFRDWMAQGRAAGLPLAGFPPFAPPVPAAGAELIPVVVAEGIRDTLRVRYLTYSEASYHLSRLVEALADLRNTYPRATLHDCEEGSDANPVRLGQTALGSN